MNETKLHLRPLGRKVTPVPAQLAAWWLKEEDSDLVIVFKGVRARHYAWDAFLSEEKQGLCITECGNVPLCGTGHIIGITFATTNIAAQHRIVLRPVGQWQRTS